MHKVLVLVGYMVITSVLDVLFCRWQRIYISGPFDSRVARQVLVLLTGAGLGQILLWE